MPPSTPPPHRDPLSRLLQPVFNFQASFLNMNNDNDSKESNTRDQKKRIATASSYMKHRLSGAHTTLLALCTDDIKLTSPSEKQVIIGKEQFKEYLERTKPRGQWDQPVLQGENIEIKGKVRFLGFVPVGVVAKFGFDQRGKIQSIFVGRE